MSEIGVTIELKAQVTAPTRCRTYFVRFFGAKLDKGSVDIAVEVISRALRWTLREGLLWRYERITKTSHIS